MRIPGLKRWVSILAVFAANVTSYLAIMIERQQSSSHAILFTRPGCGHCEAAKRALHAADIDFTERDVTASRADANASIYYTGAATVPQLVLRARPVTGSGDIRALAGNGALAGLIAATPGSPELAGEEELARGAEDLLLSGMIPLSDGAHTDDPEQWPLLRFYREFFGFWPNTFAYLHHWPQAYKLFLYCHNLGAIRAGKEVLGDVMMMATGSATSNAHGCSYCRVHMLAAAGDSSLGLGALVAAARAGTAPAGAPIGPFELSLIDLAAEATSNRVTAARLAEVTRLGPQARVSTASASHNVMGTAMIASAFGFLNVFNDMTGAKIEGPWAAKASAATGIDTGRHHSDGDRTVGNLAHDLPQGGPSLQEMIGRYEAIVAAAGGPEAYASRELGIAPDWLLRWPAPLRAQHIYFYTETMQSRPHSPIPGELKHLMARVSAVALDHDYLAAVEGYLAWRAGGADARAAARVWSAYTAASGGAVSEGLFTARECAALQLARVSAQQPLTTPRRFVEPAIERYTPTELVHLITVCAVAGLVQRFAAIAKPVLEPEVSAFLRDHGIPLDGLSNRYPPVGAATGA